MERPLQGALGDWLRHSAQIAPNQGIIHVRGSGDCRVTYAELLTDARRILGGLTAAGLQKGDVVVLQIGATDLMVPALWACLLGGVVAVPMGAPRRSDCQQLSWQHLRAAVGAQAQCRLVVSDDAAATKVTRPQGDLLSGDTILTCQALLQSDPRRVLPSVSTHDVALLQLTSGSTGTPQGVALTHTNLLAAVSGHAELELFKDAVSLCWTSFDHISGMAWHLRGVCCAVDQIVAPPDMVAADPLIWLDWLSRYRVNITRAPNFAYDAVATELAKGVVREWNLDAMCAFVVGGEPVDPRICRRFIAALEQAGLGRHQVRPAYGLTESSGGTVYGPATADRAPGVRWLDRVSLAVEARVQDMPEGSGVAVAEVGRPIPGVSIRIVDAQGAVVEEDTVGHVQLSGAAVALGPMVLTKSVAASDGAELPWRATGDLGLLSDGILCITGRQKDVIIVRGHNLMSNDLEMIAATVEGVDGTRVGACRAPGANGGTESPVIIFSLRPDAPDTATVVARGIRRVIVATFGCAPIVIPIERDAFPRTRSGKVARAELQRWFDGERHRLDESRDGFNPA